MQAHTHGASAPAKHLHTYLVSARINGTSRHFCKLARSSGEALAAMIAALPDGCAFGLSARPVGGAA